MGHSWWAVPVAVSLTTLCVLVAHPAASAGRSKSTFVPKAQAGPATPGEQLWVKRYNGPGNAGNGDDNAFALGVSPDGSTVFVTGSSTGSTFFTDYATVAHDASTGKLLWVRRYNGPGNDNDVAAALGVSPDGFTVFVTGLSFGSTGDFDYATVAYDASTGALLWVRRYNGPGNSDDFANALGVSPDGSTVFVTGSAYGGSTSTDYATVAYDASTGAGLWVRRYNGLASSASGDEATSIAVSPDGSKVFVTGSSTGSTFFSDYATVAYDASTGAGLWVMLYDGPANGDDNATALRISPDGSTVFVTGDSVGSTGFSDYATVAYDASTGSQLWVTRYEPPGIGSDVAHAIGVTPDGSTVFVTGRSDRSPSFSDYATVAYDASSGAQLWVRRYNGPRNGVDDATALGVSPDGSKVFVTGRSEGSGSREDYASIAYGIT